MNKSGQILKITLYFLATLKACCDCKLNAELLSSVISPFSHFGIFASFSGNSLALFMIYTVESSCIIIMFSLYGSKQIFIIGNGRANHCFGIRLCKLFEN